MPICFGSAKSILRFFRRPPSVNSPESCRKVSRPPEVSVPPKKQRLLASKFGFGRLRLAQLLTRFKRTMRVSTKPGEKNCKWMITKQIEVKDICERKIKITEPTQIAESHWKRSVRPRFSPRFFPDTWP